MCQKRRGSAPRGGLSIEIRVDTLRNRVLGSAPVSFRVAQTGHVARIARVCMSFHFPGKGSIDAPARTGQGRQQRLAGHRELSECLRRDLASNILMLELFEICYTLSLLGGFPWLPAHRPSVVNPCPE